VLEGLGGLTGEVVKFVGARASEARAHVALPEYSKEGASKSSGVPGLGGKM
jgi:hypothetical protein